MAYIALYRKWRPGSFKDLVGQEPIAKTLSNAITSGKIGHAYLFSGPRGTGKTSTAKIFAKALNCEHGPTPDPCNTCDNCRKINEGSSMDVFEIDAASNRGIDEIRDLRETVKFAPVDGRYKVYIIDEVHMLTAEAFNALLKTLEEPPAHVVFILATTEAHKVPATIQSRCQRYDFKRITVAEIKERLSFVAAEMGIEAEEEALSMIAVQADGGMRDALSILDQCSALADGGITAARVQQILGLVGHDWIWKMTKAIAVRDSQQVLAVIAELMRDGKDLRQVLVELALHLRSVMVYQAAGTIENMDLYNEPEKILQEQMTLFSQSVLMQMIHRLHEAMNELKWSPQPRITVEVALLSLCRPEVAVVSDRSGAAETAPEDARLAQLEAKLAQVTAALVNVPKTVTAVPGSRSKVKPAEGKKTPIQMDASLAEAVQVPQGVTAEGTTVWQSLLETLRSQKKTPVLACVEKGEFRGMNETQFFLAFKSGFLKSRTEREDYRELLESILAEISGKSLRIYCSLEKASPPPPPPVPPKRKVPIVPKEPAVEVDFDNLSQEEQERLQAAIDVFGDHFVEPKKDES